MITMMTVTVIGVKELIIKMVRIIVHTMVMLPRSFLTHYFRPNAWALPFISLVLIVTFFA